MLELTGRIDTNNAAQVEKELQKQLAAQNETQLVFDAAGLEYISSAGLRVLLRIRKQYPDIRLINVRPDVYDILDMTGFTAVMKVDKAYRSLSLDGCVEIARGSSGTIYRIDSENVVKIFNGRDALDDIRHEREMAKIALILGIPTAISYEVVKVGERYGAVYELLEARSFSQILAEEPERLDWCAAEYVKLLKTIHSTTASAGVLPEMKDTALSWAAFLRDLLPPEAGDKLTALVEAIPRDNHVIHGDYQTKNVQMLNDEVLLIDMETLSVGNPVFDLASMFNSFIGFYELDHEAIREFQGYDFETGRMFWRKTLKDYLGTNCELKLREVEDKARIIGYTRLIRRTVRRGGMETEKGRAEIENWKNELIDLLNHTDTLLFDCDELELDATDENLEVVQNFVDERLESIECPMKKQMEIAVAVEEIFINIAHYAYAPETGKAKVRVEKAEDGSAVAITFTDRGVPYNPLAKQDPDINVSANEREIGGLGIYMTKKLMDELAYEYRDGQNHLTLKKNL